MEALELILKGEQLLVADPSLNKRVIALTDSFNQSMVDMKAEIDTFKEFSDSQTEGVYGRKIATAKALAQFYQGNKLLKVENALASIENEEKAKVAEFYAKKSKLLSLLNEILKESTKMPVISAFDLFGTDFRKCETGHEVVVLNGKNSNILETFASDIDQGLVVNGNFESIAPVELNYSLDTLERVVDYCSRKNNETYGAKQGKLNKVEQVIEKLKETGTKVVAFYTFKSALEDIGCEAKGITAFENELSKAYIPFKKALQNEFKIQLEDICNVSVNEDNYPPAPIHDDSFSAEPAPTFEAQAQPQQGEPIVVDKSQDPTTNQNNNQNPFSS